MPTSSPWVRPHTNDVLAARGDPRRLTSLFDTSRVPMVLVDDGRRYIDANRPAQATLAMGLDEIRRLRIDDLTPPHLWRSMDSGWDRLLASGQITNHDLARPEGNYLGMTYYAIANVLPSRHVIAFAPPGWRGGNGGEAEREPPSLLSRRERQVLELAADGLNGPAIAEELVLSTATVRTHFGHIYKKLEANDRAAAVAKAMRLGMIR
jgi:DNA-binding CsgD family transcriptional regulator